MRISGYYPLTCRSSQRHVSPHSLLKECLLVCIWGISDELIDVMIITVYQHTHNCYGHYEKCKHQKGFSLNVQLYSHQDLVTPKPTTIATYVGLQPSVKLRRGFKAIVVFPAFSSNSWPFSGIISTHWRLTRQWHWYIISTPSPWAPLAQVDKTP